MFLLQQVHPESRDTFNIYILVWFCELSIFSFQHLVYNWLILFQAHDIVDEILLAKGDGQGRRGPYNEP